MAETYYDLEKTGDQVEGGVTGGQQMEAHKTAILIDHPDGSVTTPKIADGNITTAKIADLNITTGKIADGAININKLDSIQQARLNKHDTNSRTATYVIAATDTPNNKGADYICENVSGKYFNNIIDAIMADMAANSNKVGSMIYVRNGTYYFDGNATTINITKSCYLFFESEFDIPEGTGFVLGFNIAAPNVTFENVFSPSGLSSNGLNTRLINCNLSNGATLNADYGTIINSRIATLFVNSKYCVVQSCIFYLMNYSKSITIGANCQYCNFSNNFQYGISNPKDIYNNQSSYTNFIECAVNDENGKNIASTYQTKILPSYSAITTPSEGQTAWNATTHKPVYYNGTSWIYADGTAI